MNSLLEFKSCKHLRNPFFEEQSENKSTFSVLNYHKSSQSGETLVKVDLSTTNNVDLAKLKFVFEQNLSQNQIGSYRGQRASENWWRIIPKPGKMKNKAL